MVPVLSSKWPVWRSRLSQLIIDKKFKKVKSKSRCLTKHWSDIAIFQFLSCLCILMWNNCCSARCSSVRDQLYAHSAWISSLSLSLYEDSGCTITKLTKLNLEASYAATSWAAFFDLAPHFCDFCVRLYQQVQIYLTFVLRARCTMQMSRNRASNYPRSSVNKPLNLLFGVLAPDPRHCIVNRKCTNEYKWYIRMHTVQVNTHCVELRFQLQPVPFSHDELWDVEVLVHASRRVSMCFTISPSWVEACQGKVLPTGERRV